MDARVLVLEAAAAYRAGVVSALAQAGFLCDEPDDVGEWASGPPPRALLVTVRSTSDWEPLRRLGEDNPDVTLVALVVDPTADRYGEALRAGAHAAVAWESRPETIVETVRAALRDLTVLPTTIARALALTGPPLHDPGWVTDEEMKWLRILANGATTLELAEKIGYSERALYRVLHGLYGRMRVSNRRDAILQAQRWGLLE
jgi:two-component system, NarL family, response regulator DesR